MCLLVGAFCHGMLVFIIETSDLLCTATKFPSLLFGCKSWSADLSQIETGAVQM